MFTITREWMHQHATNEIGWTRKQVAVLGLDWPLKKGWLSRQIGRQISIADKAAFEGYGRERRDPMFTFVAALLRPGDHPPGPQVTIPQAATRKA